MDNNEHKMKRGLKSRHMQMIALGASVGTGLFYGSAPTIKLVGPGIILSYLLAGIFIFFVMRMLGEMSVREPVSGSFSYFADKYWHRFAGYLAGWNYWFLYMIAGMAELSATATYVNFWLPDFPQWLTILICILVIITVNLINVSFYGESEYWASFIKITAICCMIVFGLYLIFTTMGPFPQNFSNLWVNGGFFPNGAWGFAASLVVVMFSFGGVDLIGITAGEAENPEKTLPKAINQILIRILIFYIGTMVVLMSLSPWDQVGLQGSPFVQIFSNIGIPAAANLLNIVVLTAAISVYNSAIYSNSRMLYGLASQGNAPKILTALTRNGVPMVGIFISSGITLIAVVLNYLFPGKVFMYLVSIAVAAVLVSWFIIIVTHLKFRKAKARLGQDKDLHFKSIGYPIINYLCIVFLIFIAFMMYQVPDTRNALYILPLWIIILAIGYMLKKKK